MRNGTHCLLLRRDCTRTHVVVVLVVLHKRVLRVIEVRNCSCLLFLLIYVLQDCMCTFHSILLHNFSGKPCNYCVIDIFATHLGCNYFCREITFLAFKCTKLTTLQSATVIIIYDILISFAFTIVVLGTSYNRISILLRLGQTTFSPYITCLSHRHTFLPHHCL